jgi:hypothetical protein
MREQSVKDTKFKIRNSKTGKEISEAIKLHFKTHKSEGECQSSWKDMIADLDTPLLGTSRS